MELYSTEFSGVRVDAERSRPLVSTLINAPDSVAKHERSDINPSATSVVLLARAIFPPYAEDHIGMIISED